MNTIRLATALLLGTTLFAGAVHGRVGAQEPAPRPIVESCYEDEISIWYADHFACIAFDDLSESTRDAWITAEQAVYRELWERGDAIRLRHPDGTNWAVDPNLGEN